MAALSKSQPWDGTPLVMLFGGPRHGWVYTLADSENRGYRSSFDGYSPMRRRGDPDGDVVMSTIGAEFRHYETGDPNLAASPVQLWGYSRPRRAEPVPAVGTGFVECPECSRPGAPRGRDRYRCAEGHLWATAVPAGRRQMRSVD